MSDLKYDLRHITVDLTSIHDALDHLGSHAEICNKLVKSTNIQEAMELFNHLDEIDRLIHEVQEHVRYLDEGVRADELGPEACDQGLESEIDIDEIKSIARHTLQDLKDLHERIEHLRTHGEACCDLSEPCVGEEVEDINIHIEEIDEMIHDLIGHLSHVRGDLATRYSEFIWQIPAGQEDYLVKTELLDADSSLLQETALKLVDGCLNSEEAVASIACFVQAVLAPQIAEMRLKTPASAILKGTQGGSVAKCILICALARTVFIPAKVLFADVAVDLLDAHEEFQSVDFTGSKDTFTLSIPQVFIEDAWQDIGAICEKYPDQEAFLRHFLELGLTLADVSIIVNTNEWLHIPEAAIKTTTISSTPMEILTGPHFHPPPPDIEWRLFADRLFTGMPPANGT